MRLFEMSNHEKVWYASYLLKAGTKIQWQTLKDAQQTNMITQVKFYEAFEKEFLGADTPYVKAQEYLNLGQEHMTVKEFFTKLNALS